MNNEKKGGNFWFGFFFGGLIGAVLIFLWGTKEGKKVAKKLINQGEVFEEEIEEKITSLTKKGEDLLIQAQDVKEKLVKEFAQNKRSVSENLTGKVDQALSNLENIQQKGVEVTKDLHHKYFKKNGKKLT